MTVRKAFQLLAQAAVEDIRTEVFLGADHLVVPIVALVEGVVTPGNSGVPELALAGEFARFPAGWDGRPVFLSHPMVDGKHVAANKPEVLEGKSFGLLFNTKVEDNKLKTEAWLNLDRVKDLGKDIEDAIERLQSGELTEVSTGLFAEVEQTKGTFHGERFNSIWRGVVPDHLAILPAGTEGACSVADGCGAPRINQACTHEDNCDCIQIDGESAFMELWNKIRNVATLRDNKKGMSDSSKRAAVKSALNGSNPNRFIDIVDFVDNSVIYSSDFGDTLLQQSFSIADKGKVSLKGEPIEVRPEITFIPVQTATKELSGMTKEETVDALIANEGTRFTSDNRGWLLGLEDAQLATFEPIELQAAPTTPTPEEVAAAAAVEAEKQRLLAQPTGNPDPATVASYLADAPADVQAVIQEGINMRQAKITALVAALKANDKNDFSEDELKAMSLESLERIGKLAQVPVRILQGGAPAPRVAQADDGAPDPKPVFVNGKPADAPTQSQ